MKTHYQNLSLDNIKEYVEGVGLVIEEWKDIPGFEGLYKISSFGRVRSFPREKKGNWGHILLTKDRILKQGINKNGYPRVILYNGPTKVSFYIHVLVLNAFIDNPEGKPERNHKKGKKWNNTFFSLEWVTKSENMQHAKDIGLNKVIAEGCNFAKLTSKEVLEIFSSKLSAGKLAKMYKVSQSSIYDIKRGMDWRSVTGQQKPNRQHLTKELVLSIFKTNMSYTELEKKYKVPYYQVGAIKRGDSWSGITGKINK